MEMPTDAKLHITVKAEYPLGYISSSLTPPNDPKTMITTI